jgi:hypothetical protein
LKKESKLTREIIAKETHLVREMIKEIAEYLGNLIVAEGDKLAKVYQIDRSSESGLNPAVYHIISKK